MVSLLISDKYTNLNSNYQIIVGDHMEWVWQNYNKYAEMFKQVHIKKQPNEIIFLTGVIKKCANIFKW